MFVNAGSYRFIAFYGCQNLAFFNANVWRIVAVEGVVERHGLVVVA